MHPLYKFQTTLKSSLVSFARVRPSLPSFEVPAIVGAIPRLSAFDDERNFFLG